MFTFLFLLLRCQGNILDLVLKLLNLVHILSPKLQSEEIIDDLVNLVQLLDRVESD